MSELRRNPITGLWVIMAENRGGRPQEVETQQIVHAQSVCPFCEGHEQRTPGEVLALRAPGTPPNGPGWRVRVVPNKFPAVEPEIAPPSPSDTHPLPWRERDGVRGKDQSPTNSITQVVPGVGIHEIIIESPQHLVSITELDDGQVAAILEVYRGRLAALRQMKTFHSALVFKNGGPTAGATLVHVHSQLIAIENRQPVFADRLPQFQNHAQQFGNCPLCQMLDEVSSALPHPVGNRSVEPSEGNRLVAATPNFLAFCPFAARLAYEAWIIPRQHAAHFDAVAPESLPELAGLLRTVLVKLERIVKLPAYNYLVHTAPFDTFGSDHYHWHIEILPRTTALAGFELGTGCYINTVLPQRAAAALREA